MAFKPCHPEDEIVSRIQIEDETAFRTVKVQKLNIQIQWNFRDSDTSSCRQSNGDHITFMRLKRLNIMLIPFKGYASGIITRRP